MHFCEFLRDGNRMRNVRLARPPGLAFMGGGTEFVGLQDASDLVGGQIGFKCVDQSTHTPVPARSAGEFGEDCGRVVHSPILTGQRGAGNMPRQRRGAEKGA